jgi:hypothetical protein
MNYIPGQLHEKLQAPVAYRATSSGFSFLICDKKRYNDINISQGDEDLKDLILEDSDILILRWFVPKPNTIPYSYIDEIIRNGKSITIERESIVSKEFMILNSTEILSKNFNPFFVDVTKQYIRDKKINSILNA